MTSTGPAISRHDLATSGLINVKKAHWNLPAAVLYEHALRRGEGVMASNGPLVVETGEHTGRSPNDKFIVEDALTRDTVWWGDVNAAMTPEAFQRLHARVTAYLQGRELFVQDLHAGADPNYRLPVRVVCERAWHSLFARNMFLRPPVDDLSDFEPGFTILHAPGLQADPAEDGTNSSTFIVIDFSRRVVLIGGTEYAGEIKKSIFTVLNYLLPEQDVLPMHCSANIGADGDVALFFGLSGTGKTTLSADPSRALIGDDEHGWSDLGVFNFEGGCYAKVIRLSAEAEPEIYSTTQRFGTILENVVAAPDSRELDLDDARLTENTRASYPLEFIPNASEAAQGGHPRNLIMLTADAFGVLPPISRLTPEQAMYHFLSGYTARVAGTERGMGSAPTATFSTCFGAPFMPRHPSVYARMLGEKIARHECHCWLVNTGWTGGVYGVGKRMKIQHTRAMVRAALDGRLAECSTEVDPHFGLQIPTHCPDVPGEVLNPRNTWHDKQAYDDMARELTRRFAQNFEQFAPYVGDEVKAVAIEAAA
ncbi:phosphoenolpyruvate carboxykinase [Ferruginivarius sediminum]|uniref:Phosphoenolpyruvate carboxykinase (ATP) n=1 Tax=Ferruginivarius sediminum TaxID=2661937 RepID=A0A369T611_9PROT|nr:phosphoenolpyruvate carboxykinase [Ferruginivarius sediminum]RDD60342.1 phosphoenolpyruvate carboxykinase [Ferruginivarius sediminum]